LLKLLEVNFKSNSIPQIKEKDILKCVNKFMCVAQIKEKDILKCVNKFMCVHAHRRGGRMCICELNERSKLRSLKLLNNLRKEKEKYNRVYPRILI